MLHFAPDYPSRVDARDSQLLRRRFPCSYGSWLPSAKTVDIIAVRNQSTSSSSGSFHGVSVAFLPGNTIAEVREYARTHSWNDYTQTREYAGADKYFISEAAEGHQSNVKMKRLNGKPTLEHILASHYIPL